MKKWDQGERLKNEKEEDQKEEFWSKGEWSNKTGSDGQRSLIGEDRGHEMNLKGEKQEYEMKWKMKNNWKNKFRREWTNGKIVHKQMEK